MNIKGKAVSISDIIQVSDSFKKREFVLEYAENPQYPEFVKFETIQDKCALLDPIRIGQDIDVHFNIKGRKWTDKDGSVKYFNSLHAWKITAEGGSAAPVPQSTATVPVVTDEDDLPF